jgi:hypothetical protein
MSFEAYKLYQEYEPDKYKTSTQRKAEGVLKEADEMTQPFPRERAGQGKETISGIEFQEAKELLGKNLIGPEEIEKTWGVRLREVPDIPFSREELERAKKMRQMLVLRVDKTEDGKPMSLEAMNDILAKRWEKEKKGGLLNTAERWRDKVTGEESFKKDTPRFGWALVSKNLLPDSTNKNYIEQTEIIIKALREQAFKDMEMPEEYEEAIKEFEANKGRLTKLMSGNWQKAAEELAELKITQLTRQSIQETIYDLALYYDKNGKRLLPNVYTWSNSRSTDGNLMPLGGFGAEGMGGGGWGPGDRYGHFGVLLSRRL